jgi:hypothetical protein
VDVQHVEVNVEQPLLHLSVRKAGELTARWTCCGMGTALPPDTT